MDRIDIGPRDVFGAQPVCMAKPRCIAERSAHRIELRRHGRIGCDPKQRIRRLRLCRHEILLAIEPQQRRNEVVARRFEQARLPAERRCRVAQRRNGMSAIVLAVAPGAHPVFPGFAPVDRAQSNDNAFRCECARPARIFGKRAAFQHVIAAGVVVHAGGHAGKRRRQ
jgi:hypothetical protein